MNVAPHSSVKNVNLCRQTHLWCVLFFWLGARTNFVIMQNTALPRYACGCSLLDVSWETDHQFEGTGTPRRPNDPAHSNICDERLFPYGPSGNYSCRLSPLILILMRYSLFKYYNIARRPFL